MNKQARTRASRGTGFPEMPLDEAVEAIQRAGRYGRSHSDAAFAGYLGHKTPNSGPFRSKMAALRDFGLIERPKDGQIPLTSLGQEIAHPTGDAQKQLQEAFFSAKPFAAIYEESAKGTPLSLELVANRAVTELGINPQSKSRFAESFRRSVTIAGLGETAGEGGIRLIPPGTETAGAPADPSATSDGGELHGAASGESRPSRSAATTPERPPIIHQEWAVPGGSISFVVTLDGALPSSAFGEVGNVVTAIERFVALISPTEAPHVTDQADPQGGDVADASD
jgi:hypothetical protein